jgi:hypothetical protein
MIAAFFRKLVPNRLGPAATGGIMPLWLMLTTPRKQLLRLLLGFTFGLLLTGERPLAAQDTCKLVMDAGIKVFDVPTHLYLTMNLDGKSETGESIYADGLIYTMSNGKWGAGISNKEMKEMAEKASRNNKATCHYLKDEVVNGEMAAEYSMHDASPASASDSKIWISKSKGLPLRSETQFEGDKTTVSMHYEYRGVRPPI